MMAMDCEREIMFGCGLQAALCYPLLMNRNRRFRRSWEKENPAKGGTVKSNTLLLIAATLLFADLANPIQLPAQEHTRYKLIDLGTFGGPGSSPTEFQQVLNNSGTVVGGADTPELNPYANCFNPFNLPDCYVQHAFVWQDGVLTDLHTLRGGSSSFAYFISDNGFIVGGSEIGAIDPVAGTPEYRAVLWTQGEIKDLGTLGGTSSAAYGVNNRGQVIGIAQNAIPDAFSIAGLGTQTRAFLWQNGEMHDLHTLGGPDSFAQYVNESGQVAGVSYTSFEADPNSGLPILDPFLWENGSMKDLGNFGGTNDSLGPFLNGLNNRGEVIGAMALPGDQIFHAFLWDGEKLSDLNAWGGGLGGDYSFANGLNDAGEVIGWASPLGDQVIHAVLWRNGALADLGTLNGDPCSTSESINSRGQVVGASESGCSFFTKAFLWENGGPMVDLNALIPSGSSLQLTGAFWINDLGEITGRGVPPGCGDVDNCGHAFLLIPCDGNHPDVEGCDYSLVDLATAVEAHPAQVAEVPAGVANQAKLSPIGMMARFRSSMAGRNRRYGTLQASPQ
jgi:probable HAF family extracellular repeat protein